MGTPLSGVLNILGMTVAFAALVSEIDPSVSPDAVDVQLFDRKLQSQYETEANFSRLITLFTLLAIVISLMGVFGLVMFETEHRRKEIGVLLVTALVVTARACRAATENPSVTLKKE